MFMRVAIALALIVLAAPVTAQSASIQATARVLPTRKVVEQSPAIFVVAQRLSATLGISTSERNDPWVGYDVQVAFIGSAAGSAEAIRGVDPGATPDEGSELRADTEGLTAWGWTEGRGDGSAHMIIADLSHD
jgi:hypothetical protein